MRFNQAGAAAALFGLSSAFLLPPTISTADKDIITTLPFENGAEIGTRVMEINCPGCPAVPEIEGNMHLKQPPSMLKLNFTISHDNTDQLLLNEFPIYPIDPTTEAFMTPLTAPLMAKTMENTWEQASTPILGYSLSVRHPVSYSSQDQLDLVAIHLEIVIVGEKFVSGLPSVEIKLLETPSGQLMIGDASITQPKSEVAKPTDDGQECTTILCKWRAIVADRLSKLKGCGSKARPEPKVFSGHKKPHHKGHHGRPGPHRPFRHHHRHGGFARFLKGIVLHVFIPVLIGIMVGITASLVGMVAGHIVIFVWRTVFRRGQKQQYTKVQPKESKDEAEVESFLGHQGPPPEYEEAIVEKTEQ
jgi:hypothetical protein